MVFLRQGLNAIVYSHLVGYPTPANINYFWGFGSAAGILLGCQIVTGVLLAMHYAPTTELAFASLEHIMRDVNYGWFLRYAHANGASFFFIAVYCHLGRSFIYGLYTYARRFLWFSGLIIFFLMMATAFMGYVLPWGQMSFWGATVITNLFSVVPFAGEDIAYWLWGGFSVGNATLNRFFSLHFCLPFILAAMVIVHLAVLHSVGSSSVFGLAKYPDKIFFYPYFYVKDYFGIVFVGLIFLSIISYAPDLLGHPDNYILANPLVTPTHIVPEWYFLPYYALLRSIPNKLAGVVVMGLSICVCLVLPFFSTPLRSMYSQGRFLYRWLAWSFVSTVFLLGFLGGQPIEDPYSFFAQLFAFFYFLFFLLVVWLDYIHANFLFFTYSRPSVTSGLLILTFTERKKFIKMDTLRVFWVRLYRLVLQPRPGPTARVVLSRSHRGFRLWALKNDTLRKALFLFALTRTKIGFPGSRRFAAPAFLSLWGWATTLLQQVNACYAPRAYHQVAKQKYLRSLTPLEREYRHPFHLVTVSPWPFSISFAITALLVGVAAFFHRYTASEDLLTYGFLFLLYVMLRWFTDITREGTLEGSHLEKVQWGLKSGMLLFITSEVLFFFAFFWGFFHSSLAPAIQIGGIWPPLGIQVFNPWEVPLLNTLILLTSGAAVTWAHFAIRSSTKSRLRSFLAYTWLERHARKHWLIKATALRFYAQRLRVRVKRRLLHSHDLIPDHIDFLRAYDIPREYDPEWAHPYHKIYRRLYPFRRVRMLVMFSTFLDLYRRWSFLAIGGYIALRRKPWVFLSIRRQVNEFSSGFLPLLWRFLLSPEGLQQQSSLFGNESHFLGAYKFRIRRSQFFLKRFPLKILFALRQKIPHASRRYPSKLFFCRSALLTKGFYPTVYSPFSRRLLKSGHPIRVYDRAWNKAKAKKRAINTFAAFCNYCCRVDRFYRLQEILTFSALKFFTARSTTWHQFYTQFQSYMTTNKKKKIGSPKLATGSFVFFFNVEPKSRSASYSSLLYPFRLFVELNSFLVYFGLLTAIIAKRRMFSQYSRSRWDVLYGLGLTIFLGFLFTVIQYYEYLHASFTIADSAYGATFFLTTGFHGLHVIIGTLLLLVSYRRMRRYHFTLTHHVGLEAAIWYWHFVDVVWLGLYLSVYHWGGQF